MVSGMDLSMVSTSLDQLVRQLMEGAQDSSWLCVEEYVEGNEGGNIHVTNPLLISFFLFLVF